MKTKKYEIDSLKQICNVVTNKNFEGFCIDFMMWLKGYIKVMEKSREQMPKETEGKTNWEICQSKFIWYDDGKNDLKGFTVKDNNTGEITEKRFTK